MTDIRHTLLIATFSALSVLTARAQELEYALELGLMAGPTTYYGDANYSSPFKNPHAAVSLLGRYNINQRMSLKMDIAMSKISGDGQKADTQFPQNPEQQWSFSNQLVDVSVMYELSFWGYGTGGSYKGSRRLTPYIALGLGGSVAGKEFAMNLPIALGVKYKFAPRWNCGADLSIHFTTSDKMDGIVDPHGIKSDGVFKNKDSYSMLLFYVSYDLCPKYRKCNNE